MFNLVYRSTQRLLVGLTAILANSCVQTNSHLEGEAKDVLRGKLVARNDFVPFRVLSVSATTVTLELPAKAKLFYILIVERKDGGISPSGFKVVARIGDVFRIAGSGSFFPDRYFLAAIDKVKGPQWEWSASRKGTMLGCDRCMM